MKFKRSTKIGSVQETTTTPLNLKTIVKKGVNSRKKVNFKFFELAEEKENNRRLKRRSPCSPALRLDDAAVLSERLAQGLSLRGGGGDFKEAKPIPKPVLSFMVPPQNYFKRSFSMRARSTQSNEFSVVSGGDGSKPAEDPTGVAEQKTATIRRAFGKSLTSKDNLG